MLFKLVWKLKFAGFLSVYFFNIYMEMWKICQSDLQVWYFCKVLILLFPVNFTICGWANLCWYFCRSLCRIRMASQDLRGMSCCQQSMILQLQPKRTQYQVPTTSHNRQSVILRVQRNSAQVLHGQHNSQHLHPCQHRLLTSANFCPSLIGSDHLLQKGVERNHRLQNLPVMKHWNLSLTVLTNLTLYPKAKAVVLQNP